MFAVSVVPLVIEDKMPPGDECLTTYVLNVATGREEYSAELLQSLAPIQPYYSRIWVPKKPTYFRSQGTTELIHTVLYPSYLCDDLFFRKIATWMGVRNLNIVSLVQHYNDPDYMVPIIKELSKTNYVYIPLRARTDEEFGEICRNVLDGKKKAVFYSEIIQKFIEIRDRVLREYFGYEFVDKMYREQSEAEIT